MTLPRKLSGFMSLHHVYSWYKAPIAEASNRSPEQLETEYGSRWRPGAANRKMWCYVMSVVRAVQARKGQSKTGSHQGAMLNEEKIVQQLDAERGQWPVSKYVRDVLMGTKHHAADADSSDVATAAGSTVGDPPPPPHSSNTAEQAADDPVLHSSRDVGPAAAGSAQEGSMANPAIATSQLPPIGLAPAAMLPSAERGRTCKAAHAPPAGPARAGKHTQAAGSMGGRKAAFPTLRRPELHGGVERNTVLLYNRGGPNDIRPAPGELQEPPIEGELEEFSNSLGRAVYRA